MLSFLRTAVLFSTSDLLASLPLTGSERWQRQTLRQCRGRWGCYQMPACETGRGR